MMHHEGKPKITVMRLQNQAERGFKLFTLKTTNKMKEGPSIIKIEEEVTI